jgi:hypothetical protein
MVEEVGGLDLRDRLPKGKLQEPFYDVNERMKISSSRWVSLLLYGVWG